MSTFSLFFILCQYFEVERIVSTEFDLVFCYFSPIPLYTRRYARRMISVLYFRSISKAFIQKCWRIFKVLSVWNFLIIKEGNYRSLQDKVFIAPENKLLWIFQNSNVTVCGPSHTLKLKHLFFSIDDDMQKICLWKLFTDRSFPGKKLIDFPNAHQAFFTSFKSTMIYLKISLYMSMFI